MRYIKRVYNSEILLHSKKNQIYFSYRHLFIDKVIEKNQNGGFCFSVYFIWRTLLLIIKPKKRFAAFSQVTNSEYFYITLILRKNTLIGEKYDLMNKQYLQIQYSFKCSQSYSRFKFSLLGSVTFLSIKTTYRIIDTTAAGLTLACDS